MLPTVRLQRPDSETNCESQGWSSKLGPARTEESLMCEAVALPPLSQLPYEFELRDGEGLQFIFRSELPIDLLLTKTSDYDAWRRADSLAAPLMVYAEALDSVGDATNLVVPADDRDTAVLMNENARGVDVAVEIRISPPARSRASSLGHCPTLQSVDSSRAVQEDSISGTAGSVRHSGTEFLG